MSSIKKWAEHASVAAAAGRQHHRSKGGADEDDFASEFVLPDGPLQLHVRPKTSSSSRHSRAESASASSNSGGSLLFSDSEQSSSRRTDGENEDDDDDERSNTLKAGQLPESFAAQLAISKQQAALAKMQQQPQQDVQHAGKVTHLGSKSTSSPEQSMDWDEDIEGLRSARRLIVRKASFASHISDSEDEDDKITPTSRSKLASSRKSQAGMAHVKSTTTLHDRDENDDIESDFELPESVSSVSLSVSATARRQASANELQRIPSPALGSSRSSAGSVQSSRLSSSATMKQSSASSRSHARTATSMSQTSSAGKPSDEDFFDEIVLPSYFGKQGDDETTPPSSVDSAAGKKVDLQAILKEKMASKAGIAKMAERQASATSSSLKSSISTGKAALTGAKGSIRHKYREQPGEDFEDGLVLDEQPPQIASVPAKSRLGSSSPASRSPTHLTPASRPSLKSAKSNLALNAVANASITPTALPRSASYSQGSDRTQTLRSKPSMSNLSVRTASPGPSLARRKSNAFLAAAAAGDQTPRPASPAYAQPTRSFLARQHSGPTSSDSYQSFASAGHMHLRAGLPGGSRPGTPQSPGVAATFSRLTQPTVASRAKARSLTAASDPSGRSSASLGQPIPSPSGMSGIAAIPLTRNLRQPSSLRRAQQFGDGSELDAFDDLPVNKEKEKRFVKAPRRRQSSGTATDIVPELSAGKGKHVSARMQRDRMESAPVRLQHGKRRGQNASGGSTTSTVVDAHAKAARVSIESKRPNLQLIKGLNAAKLSKVQGEMKWNPVLMKWEGNEASLRDFDNVLASSARPALISPIFGPMSPRHLYSKSPLSTPPSGVATTSTGTVNMQLSGVRVVGDMIFDPVRMSWFTTAAEGEDEIDFGDDEADVSLSSAGSGAVDAWEGGENMRLKTRRSFANDWGSNASEAGEADDDPEVAKANWEAFKKRTFDAQKRHDAEMAAWQTVRSRQPSSDRSYLHAIHALVKD